MRSLCLAVFLFLAAVIQGLPINNPADAALYYPEDDPAVLCRCSQFGFGVGFYGDYVFNRHLRTSRGKDIDYTKIFTNAALLIVNLGNRFDFFSTLGSTRLSLNTSLGAFNSADPHPLFEVESQSAFSYSLGARLTFFECRGLFLGLEGQYFATHPNVKRMYIASGAVSYPSDALKTRYSEWQVGGGAAYRLNAYFIPYAGVKYARSFWKLNNGNRFIIETNTGSFLFNLHNQKKWGYAVGVTLYPLACHKYAVTAEGRFGDEKAFFVNGVIRY